MTVTVKVTLLLKAGVALLTVFVTARFASNTLTEAEAELLAALASVLVVVIVAVLTTGESVVTVATIDNVADAPFARFPTDHTPVPEVYVPTDGVDDTYVRPAGNRSVTETAVASSGPLLVAVTVNVTLPPAAGFAVLTVFATATSALGRRTRTSSPVLDPEAYEAVAVAPTTARVGSVYVAVAGFWKVPSAAAAIDTSNVTSTWPLPGMVKESQTGALDPAVGLVVDGRVAPPVRVTVPVDA